ncbi:MAG: anti-sigma factor family protein [Planctomycetota bacterium]
MNTSAEQQPADDDATVDPQLTQLVAYLDGELPEDASARIERQLSADPPLRQQAESLDRTWQMLGLLEDAPASAEFVSKTLATIQALPAIDSSPAGAQSALRTLFSRSRLLALTAGLALGFAATAAGLKVSENDGLRNSRSQDLEILQQLEMLQQYPQLRSIPNAAFLQELAAAAAAGDQP